MSHAAPPPTHPTFREALLYWTRLGLISFGGPAGQISLMHRELVEKKRWISESHFLHAINFCMLLPGPEAQQLATYLGWRLHGWKGGLAAGVMFVLPAAFLLFALSWLYMAGGNLPWLNALFYGLSAPVIAIVAEAVLRIGKKALKSPALWTLAAGSFVAIHFLQASFVLIILTAALVGWIGHHQAPRLFPGGQGHGASADAGEAACLVLPRSPAPTWGRAVRISSLCLFLWWVPLLGLGLWLGSGHVVVQEGLFFSKASLVTFGGAYAVLPYVAQQAVETHQWLSHPQMMAGLALAETTPGPLIMVLQFVGFVGAWQNPGELSPLLAGTLGAFITTWVTFVPCFLWVFLGAPHVEGLRSQPRLGASLTAITAAVVGVILNLGVDFATHTLKPTENSPMDWFAGAVAAAAFVCLWRFKFGLIPVLVGSAGAGFLWKTFLAA